MRRITCKPDTLGSDVSDVQQYPHSNTNVDAIVHIWSWLIRIFNICVFDHRLFSVLIGCMILL